MSVTQIDLLMNSYFERTPIIEWSYVGFLEAMKPYLNSVQGPQDKQKSIWRKRFLTLLTNILVDEEDQKTQNDNSKTRFETATYLVQQVSQLSTYLNLISESSSATSGRCRPSRSTGCRSLKEAWDVLCISRSQKAGEYVNEVNSRIMKQAEMAREEEAGQQDYNEEEEKPIKELQDKEVEEVENEEDEFTFQDKELFTQRFQSMKDDKKWKLSTGTYVEDVLYNLGIKCRYYNLVHSFIIDSEDKFVQSGFTSDELTEIRETKSMYESPQIDNELLGYIDRTQQKTYEKHFILHTLDFAKITIL